MMEMMETEVMMGMMGVSGRGGKNTCNGKRRNLANVPNIGFGNGTRAPCHVDWTT